MVTPLVTGTRVTFKRDWVKSPIERQGAIIAGKVCVPKAMQLGSKPILLGEPGYDQTIILKPLLLYLVKLMDGSTLYVPYHVLVEHELVN